MTDGPAREAHLARLKAVYDRAPVKRTYRMELSYTEDGRAVFDMPYDPAFDNAAGSIHGGVFATLMDYAGWFTAAVKYRTWISTVDLQIQLLEPVDKRALRAVGELVRTGQRLAVTRMEVLSDDGRRVAIGAATFAVTSVPLPPADG